eukprot:5640968-Amphidinium_carterae.1
MRGRAELLPAAPAATAVKPIQQMSDERTPGWSVEFRAWYRDSNGYDDHSAGWAPAAGRLHEMGFLSTEVLTELVWAIVNKLILRQKAMAVWCSGVLLASGARGLRTAHELCHGERRPTKINPD